ncbi:carboxyl-terminal processing protease [Mesorhizobium soli]|uniref:S41 family peptidase n=1 Tax=Pseudaminobacter soli (ex Li et al. 2025) TaxID=1295366 RepID=UPI002473B000|nr:S41 family peptidase [Mesorhizobium soli]MDH6232981.1 carboxyl-terminal processing protease [Mesorhizobium soli]
MSELQPNPPLAPTRRAEIATAIYEAIRTCFAHWEAIPDFDLDRNFRIYLEEAFGAGDRYGFDLATLCFVASLSNGHTAFGDEWLWREHGAPLGFDAKLDQDGWQVTRSAIDALVPGERIAGINGEPIALLAAEQMKFVSGSSLPEKAHRLFSRPYLFPTAFVIETTDGRTSWIERGSTLPELPAEPSGRWIDYDRCFLLSIPSFAEPRFELQAIELLRPLHDNVHLIVDVRGNSGGSTPCELVAALMPTCYRYWTYTTPVSNGLDRALGMLSSMTVTEASWIEPRSSAFGGPLTIVVDGGTFSAAEDFVMPFKDNARARIVGKPTGGSSGQPYFRDLGDGMRLWVSAKRQYLPDETPFEGIGIQPDMIWSYQECQKLLINGAK